MARGELKRKPIGKRHWAIPEGYIPATSVSKDKDLISHEAVCLLNTADKPARVEIRIYFSDREPVGPYRVTVEPRRTKHLRFNDLKHPAPIPLATDYSTTIESDIPIIVQHTRLDSRNPPNRPNDDDRIRGG